MKRDGHTHSMYCQHGSHEPTEAMIERAIDHGFRVYSVTEHAPLPPGFASSLPYPAETVASLQLDPRALDDYLDDMHRLKERFAPYIQILVGFELDYIPAYADWTQGFLERVGTRMEDGILSVHFLPVGETWYGIDLSAEHMAQEILPHYGSMAGVERAYYAWLTQAVTADLGPHKPTRIGHLTRCRMFQRDFPPTPVEEAGRLDGEREALLQTIRQHGYALDHNMSGRDHPGCGEPYPPDPIAARARAMGIPLIYGSDAHRVADVGRYYDVSEPLRAPAP